MPPDRRGRRPDPLSRTQSLPCSDLQAEPGLAESPLANPGWLCMIPSPGLKVPEAIVRGRRGGDSRRTGCLFIEVLGTTRMGGKEAGPWYDT